MHCVHVYVFFYCHQLHACFINEISHALLSVHRQKAIPVESVSEGERAGPSERYMLDPNTH